MGYWNLASCKGCVLLTKRFSSLRYKLSYRRLDVVFASRGEFPRHFSGVFRGLQESTQSDETFSVLLPLLAVNQPKKVSSNRGKRTSGERTELHSPPLKWAILVGYRSSSEVCSALISRGFRPCDVTFRKCQLQK